MKFEASVVIPCYNEEASLPSLKDRFSRLPLFSSGKMELVLVDDGSRDSTWTQLSAWAIENENVSAAKLSRNCGLQKAFLAGISLAQGDAVGVMDADLQDPPELLEEMLARLQEGCGAAIGLKKNRSDGSLLLGILKTFATSVFPVPAGEGDFCLMKQDLARDLLYYAREDLPFRNRRYWALKGRRVHYFRFRREPRMAGSTQWNLRKLAALWRCTALGYLRSGGKIEKPWNPPVERLIRQKKLCSLD